jgi:hypothetical protein
LTNGHVVSILGQSLHEFAGYARNMQTLALHLSRIEQVTHVLFKPHPRETKDEARRSLNALREHLPQARLFNSFSVEGILCASDVAISVISNCLYDACYLNRCASRPLVVPLSFIADRSLLEDLEANVGISHLPYEASGTVRAIFGEENVGGKLRTALTSEAGLARWKNSHDYLPAPGKAARRVLDRIMRSLRS